MPTRRILITGASSGIGRYAAKYLAERGHFVIGAGRKQEALDQLHSETGPNLVTAVLDMTDGDAIAAMPERVLELTEGKGIDALVNNAGIAVPGCILDLPMDQLRLQFETNVFGLVALTKAMLPQMLEHDDSRLVNISSVSGRWSRPLMSAYNGSKHALEALSDGMRWELLGLGVRTVVVEPGPIKSDIPHRTMAQLDRLDLENSPYRHLYEKSKDIVALFERVAANPIHVARVIEKALVLPNPKARYVVPWYLELALLLYHLTPTTILDSLVVKRAQLTPEHLHWKRKGSGQ